MVPILQQMIPTYNHTMNETNNQYVRKLVYILITTHLLHFATIIIYCKWTCLDGQWNLTFATDDANKLHYCYRWTASDIIIGKSHYYY